MAVEAALLPLESQQPVPVFGHVDVAVNNPPRWATTHPGGHDEHEAAAATLATLAATLTATLALAATALAPTLPPPLSPPPLSPPPPSPPPSPPPLSPTTIELIYLVTK